MVPLSASVRGSDRRYPALHYGNGKWSLRNQILCGLCLKTVRNRDDEIGCCKCHGWGVGVEGPLRCRRSVVVRAKLPSVSIIQSRLLHVMLKSASGMRFADIVTLIVVSGLVDEAPVHGGRKRCGSRCTNDAGTVARQAISLVQADHEAGELPASSRAINTFRAMC
jgi:hypothetical protein